MPTVADILRRYGPEYLAKHGHDVEPHQAKTLRDLMACRTPAMGGHVWKCGECEHQHYRYHSCRNRHCPTCGGPAKGRWFDRMLELALPVEYLHSVFTLPHGPLLEMVLMNARLLYGLLFQSAWKALSQEPAKRFGVQLGAVMVLHTWGQRMNWHIHIHCLLPIGGLLKDGSRWIGSWDLESLLKVDDLAIRFRTAYLAGLDRLHRRGELHVPSSARHLLPATDGPLASKDWVVHCQRPPEHCQAPDAAIKYLANYVKGTAISDKRIVADDGRYVTFSAKDYRHDSRRITLRVTGEEFVRRFLTHILPPRTFRVRYYGFYTNRNRNADLIRCRKLLGVTDEPNATLFDKSDANAWDGDADDESKADDSAPAACPECGCRDMVWLCDILPQAMWRVQLHLHTFPKAVRREESVLFRPFARPP